MKAQLVAEVLPEGEFEQAKVGTVSSPEGYRSHRRFFRPMAYVAVATVGTISTLGAHQLLPESSGSYFQISGTGDMIVVARSATTAQRFSALATRLSNLYRASGLTWGEIAKSLGVSRRAVHHWMSGQLPSDRHIERVSNLENLVGDFDTGSAGDTREALVAVDQSGSSALARFSSESLPHRSTPLSSVTLGEFLSSDNSAEPPERISQHRSSTIKGVGKLSRENRRD